MERVSRKQLLATGAFAAARDMVQRGLDVGLPVVPRLLEAGYFEIIMSALTAFQLLGDPSQASAGSIQWGVLSLLDILLLQAADPAPIISRLRSGGVDMFRYCIDHPRVHVRDFGMDTALNAIKIAAAVRLFFSSCAKTPIKCARAS